MKINTCFKLFGQYICFTYNKQEKVGRIVEIRIDSSDVLIVGIDEDGFIEEYDVAEIDVKQSQSNKQTLLKQIIRLVDKDINSFKYDLIQYRNDDINQIMEEIDNQDLEDRISDLLFKEHHISDLTEIYNIINDLYLTTSQKKLICGLIAYKQYDQNTAFNYFGNEWLLNINDKDRCRDLIMVADQFNNDALCFYLIYKSGFSTITCLTVISGIVIVLRQIFNHVTDELLLFTVETPVHF